jgi:hypothetical protein
MNTTLSLSWRNTLDSMSASLVVELRQVRSFHLDRDVLALCQAVLSAHAGEVLHVRRCEVLREQLGIVSAFSGPDLNESFHGRAPWLNLRLRIATSMRHFASANHFFASSCEEPVRITNQTILACCWAWCMVVYLLMEEECGIEPQTRCRVRTAFQADPITIRDTLPKRQQMIERRSCGC